MPSPCPDNTIESINEWFNLARPNPTVEDWNVQFGVHVEEFVETLQSLVGKDKETNMQLVTAIAVCGMLADTLKDKKGQVEIVNHELFADGCGDTIVTAIGVMHDANMDAVAIPKEVDKSNWTKYGVDGVPKFKPNGKVDKDLSTYQPPNLIPYLYK